MEMFGLSRPGAPIRAPGVAPSPGSWRDLMAKGDLCEWGTSAGTGFIAWGRIDEYAIVRNPGASTPALKAKKKKKPKTHAAL